MWWLPAHAGGSSACVASADFVTIKMEIPTSCDQSSESSDRQACLIKAQFEASKIPKPRAILTEQQAVHIFELKLRMTSSNLKNRSLTAAGIAKVFGVNEKTVRDIWKGRTWSRETWHMDCSRQVLIKPSGRPKGSKDTRPRQQRNSNRQMSCHGEQPVDRLTSHSLLQIAEASAARWLEYPQSNIPSMSTLTGGEDRYDDDHGRPVWHVCSPEGGISDQHWPLSASTGSIDAHLDEWAQGRKSLIELQDPFQDDWPHQNAQIECNC